MVSEDSNRRVGGNGRVGREDLDPASRESPPGLEGSSCSGECPVTAPDTLTKDVMIVSVVRFARKANRRVRQRGLRLRIDERGDGARRWSSDAEHSRIKTSNSYSKVPSIIRFITLVDCVRDFLFDPRATFQRSQVALLYGFRAVDVLGSDGYGADVRLIIRIKAWESSSSASVAIMGPRSKGR